MADEKTLNVTRSEFFNRLRNLLPPMYRTLPDERLHQFAASLDPRIASMKFEEEPPPPMGMGEAFFQSTKEQIYRAPEIFASTYNILSSKFLRDKDNPLDEEQAQYRLQVGTS
jgi:hypothetical protein